MRVYNLSLKNIGPFREEFIEFITENDNPQKPPVTIITGENGTGKTIVLDALRGIMGGVWIKLERDITANAIFEVSAKIDYNYDLKTPTKDNNNNLSIPILTAKIKGLDNAINPFHWQFNNFFIPNPVDDNFPKWVVNYFTSKLSNDSFTISSLTNIESHKFLVDSLSGVHKNQDTVNTICYFDYMRSSEDKKEREVGEYLFSQLKKITEISLNNGTFSHVSRTKLQPIIKQNGVELSLDKLSSGNLYLMQRLIHVLMQMYCVHLLHDTPVAEICQTPGLLLIDEAENHLHPKWQKVFLQHILSIFPNLQIILTTHSPFIVSSIENARVYVCEGKEGYSIIKDETDRYANLPIEEILTTELFDTDSFNIEISNLLKERKIAIQSHQSAAAKKIEKELLKRNPQYFSYFEMDEMLQKLYQK